MSVPKDSFIWLTFFALTGIWVLTLAGSLTTTRIYTPSISVFIDDVAWIRWVYMLFVGALTISRTGVVYHGMFYKLDGYDLDGFWNKWAPRIAFVTGSAQLVCFSIVGSFSVTLDPAWHYVAAMGTVVFGLICEFILLARRYLSGKVSGETLLANLVCWAGTYISLLVFAIITHANTYNELRSNMAFAEWVGYYLVAYANFYRSEDLIIHYDQVKAMEEKGATSLLAESSVIRSRVSGVVGDEEEADTDRLLPPSRYLEGVRLRR